MLQETRNNGYLCEQVQIMNMVKGQDVYIYL